jgi:hypothetical protein
VIAALTTIRQEWEEAADGQPLEEVYGSVGLLLNDIAQSIGLAEVLEPIA